MKTASMKLAALVALAPPVAGSAQTDAALQLGETLLHITAAPAGRVN